jgi:glycerophosphoryl diester phosphodiesterase
MLSRLLSLDTPSVIAHRGGSKLRPENTIPAFEHAVSLGVDAIECDVHLSKDGEVVVIHDDRLDRTTDHTGPVSRLTAAELAQVDAGAKFQAADGQASYRGSNIGVPLLSDVLSRCPHIPVIVEIKGDQPEIVDTVLRVIRDAGAESRVIVGGFSRRVLAAVRATSPGTLTSASLPEVQSAIRRSWCWLPPRRTGFQLFQIPLRFRGRQVLRRHIVRAARRGGFPVQAWIVDDPADMRMILDWGVTGIITDRPDVAIEEVTRRLAS